MSDAGVMACAVALPALGALGIAFCHRWPNLREAVTLTTAMLLFLAVASLVPAVLAGARPGVRLFEPMPGLAIAFTVEPLGMLFALIASGLWIVNSIYSIGYMRGNGEAHQTRFYVCFARHRAALGSPSPQLIRCSCSTRCSHSSPSWSPSLHGGAARRGGGSTSRS